MATFAPSLTSTNQIFKEYKNLFTAGKITHLSATRIQSNIHTIPGIGYPWFLFDPTLDGFQTAKTYYLSSANRQVSGYPTTVSPNNIQEAYGKCIPWSNLTVPGSASYINQAFIDNCKDEPFWFYVIPPTSGTPIPVVIHFPKYTNANTPTQTPVNQWILSPKSADLDSRKITLWKTTTGVAIETYSNGRTIRQHTTSPVVTSFYWIESLLGYVSMLTMPWKSRLQASKYVTYSARPSSNLVDYNNPTTVLIPSDIYNLNALEQTKPHSSTFTKANYLQQLKTVLLSSGILDKSFAPGETAVKQLSSLYSINTYPGVADIRTMFDFLTGEKYKWNTPSTYAGVLPIKADTLIRTPSTTAPYFTLTPPKSSSLIYGLPSENYHNQTSNWNLEYTVKATGRTSLRNTYMRIIQRHLANWRTLTAIPLTARNLFSFDPSLNTMVITIKPVMNLFNWLSNWTLYHPQLQTWVSYTSAPGLAHFTKTGLLTSSNFVTYNKLSSVLVSAVSLNVNQPDYWKTTNTGSHFGKYEIYPSKTPRETVSVKELSCTGSFPISSIAVLSPITYITDYSQEAITSGRVLSGTIFFTASAFIPVNVNGNIITTNLSGSQYLNKFNAAIVLPPTRVAVRTPVLVLSGSQIRTNSSEFATDATFVLGQLLSSGGISLGNNISSVNDINDLAYSTYAFGQIPVNVFRSAAIYRNLKWTFLGLTTKDRVQSILERSGDALNGIKSILPILPKIEPLPPTYDTSLIPSLDTRTSNFEVIQLQTKPTPIGSIGLHPYDTSGFQYSFTNIHRTNNKQVRGPYNLQPSIYWEQPVTTTNYVRGVGDGKLHYPLTKYGKKERTKTPIFDRQRRKRVLGY